MPLSKQPIQSDQLLDKHQVCEMLGVQPRTLERWIALRSFPPAIRLGGCSLRWKLSTVQAHIDRLEAEAERHAH